MRRRSTAVLLCVLLLVLAGCTSNNEGANNNGPKHITVWTGDTLPDRVQATRVLADHFTQRTGIEVTLQSVDEDQFAESLTRAAADGKIPDVIASQPLSAIYTLATAQLLDMDAASQVVQGLDPETFEPRALQLTSDGQHQLAVPSDSWVQFIYYRKDWFAKEHLPPPATFEDLQHAAAVLNKPGERVGFVGPDVAGDNFTHQVFEEFGLANGCEVQDPHGSVTFDNQACVAALAFYGDLLNRYSSAGAQDVDSVRTDYFAGRAAMVVWSSFLLDELAGLRDNVHPTCTECQTDPMFLAHNTGIVSGLSGPYGTKPAQFGEINSWAILVDSERDASEAFVHYMLSDGYKEWLSFAPEGKVPLRYGQIPGSTEFLDAWRKMPTGVDRKALLTDLYPPNVTLNLAVGPSGFQQWRGDLVGASLSELPIAAAVDVTVRGMLSPQQAAERAANTLRDIQATLPRS